MALTTLAKVKTFLGIDNTGSDAVLNQILLQTEALALKYIGTNIETDAHTEYFSPALGQSSLVLNSMPVAESSVSVWQDSDRDFETEDLLVLDDDYIVNEKSGIIQTINVSFREGIKTVKVTYSSGYATVPSDIEFAIIMQVAFFFQRKDQIGIGSESTDGSLSINKSFGLLPEVKRMLEKYKVYL